MKYMINFETDERLTEAEECELMDFINQFGGEIKITYDSESENEDAWF